MTKLTTLVFIFTAPTIAGAFVIAVLAMDMALSNAMPIVAAAALGVLIALPASYFIAKSILRVTENQPGKRPVGDAAG